MKQAGEQVYYGKIQIGSCNQIIGFAVMDNFAGLIKNQAGHQQYYPNRKYQAQG